MAQSIGDRIESIKSKFDREIQKLSVQRDREIVQALSDAGVNLGSSAAAPAPQSAGPTNGRRKKAGRKKKKKTTAATSVASSRGRAKRLTKDRKAGLVEKAMELFSRNQGKRYGRKQIAKHLKVKPTQVSTVLSGIKGLKTEGDKATRVYYI